MKMTVIDIDKLLETTSDLTSEKNNQKMKMKTIEIDMLLEKTRDW